MYLYYIYLQTLQVTRYAKRF